MTQAFTGQRGQGIFRTMQPAIHQFPGGAGNLDGKLVIALQQAQAGTVTGDGCGANFVKAGHSWFPGSVGRGHSNLSEPAAAKPYQSIAAKLPQSNYWGQTPVHFAASNVLGSDPILEAELEPKHRVVLVTGGAKGIGRGIVLHLAAAGWKVVFCDTDQAAGEQLEASSEHNILFVQGDVASEPDVERIISQTVNRAGGLNAVINNAGIADPHTGPVEELSLEQWQRRLDVNLTGPFLVTKHAVPHLRKNRGAIINMASTRALQSEPESEAYAATKGGLVALTHALAVSLGPDIRANCISPGWIDTRGWQGTTETPEPLSASDHQQHPAGRVGTPDDIAAMVAYLISPEASFITGQNFVVDGGMTRKMIYEE